MAHPHLEATQWARERFAQGEWKIVRFGWFKFRDPAAAMEFKLRWG